MSRTSHPHIDHAHPANRWMDSPMESGLAHLRSAPQPAPLPYVALLDRAYQLGRADARLAVDLGLPEDPTQPTFCWPAGDPEGFARTLWAARSGRPPFGLTLNAGHWYAQGFRDGLADASPPEPPPAR